MPSRWLPVRCCSRTSGTIISTRRPTSSTCTSASCARRSTPSSSGRCCARCATRATWSPRLISMMRSSALSLALGYVALGIAALVLFAAPLYYAWQVTIQDGRSEILQADALRLTDVYRREGGEGLKNFIDARVNLQIAGDRILLLTDGSLKPLSGNLPEWPRNLPTTPGNYRINVDMGGHSIQETLVHVALLGNYYLLVGRDNKLFAPLERRFWYGLTAAIAVLSIAGVLVGPLTR